MNEIHLFGGVGGGILGGMLLGHTPVCMVEINEYCCDVVEQRQRDGCLPRFPIGRGDIRDFDGTPYRGWVNAVCGGFPCQDISNARTNSNVNGKQRGIAGKSSSLWFEMLRVVGEVQPQYVFAENSPNLRTKGLREVVTGLADLGYTSRWGVFGLRQFGADHARKRMFILASNTHLSQCKGGGLSIGVHPQYPHLVCPDWWKSEPRVERVADGMANRLDRLRAIGNGQVAVVAALAWTTLIQQF